MKPVIKLGLAGILLVGAFSWGVAVPVYKVFPWDFVRNTKKALFEEPRAYVNNAAMVAGENDAWLTAQAQNVMLGDSITAAGRWNEYFPDVSIVNRGVGGDTVTGVAKRLPHIFQLKPGRVFLLIGINDVYGRNHNDYIIQKYEEIASAFAKRDTQLVIQSTLPCSGATCDEAKLLQIADLNQRLRSLAKKYSHIFVDLNAVFAPDGELKTEYTTDGIHLNGAGLRRWSELLTPLLAL